MNPVQFLSLSLLSWFSVFFVISFVGTVLKVSNKSTTNTQSMWVFARLGLVYFYMRPRISIRGRVRPSVRPSVGPSVVTSVCLSRVIFEWGKSLFFRLDRLQMTNNDNNNNKDDDNDKWVPTKKVASHVPPRYLFFLFPFFFFWRANNNFFFQRHRRPSLWACFLRLNEKLVNESLNSYFITLPHPSPTFFRGYLLWYRGRVVYFERHTEFFLR